MTSRNQRRNRKLSEARQSVLELEAIVRQLAAKIKGTGHPVTFTVEPMGPHRTDYNTGKFLDRLWIEGEQWTVGEIAQMLLRAQGQEITLGRITLDRARAPGST